MQQRTNCSGYHVIRVYSAIKDITVCLMDLESSVLILNYLIIAKAKVMALGLARPLVRHISRMDRRKGVTPLTFSSRFITKRKVLRGEDLTSVIRGCYLMTFQ